MRKRNLLLAALVTIAGLVALRWPRLDAGVALVAKSRLDSESLELEYRMDRPFIVCATHVATGPGATRKAKRVCSVASRYDWLRGEHLARLRISKTEALRVNDAEVAIWCGQPASEARLTRILTGTVYGDSVGVEAVMIAVRDGGTEAILVYAGTEAEQYCP